MAQHHDEVIVQSTIGLRTTSELTVVLRSVPDNRRSTAWRGWLRHRAGDYLSVTRRPRRASVASPARASGGSAHDLRAVRILLALSFRERHPAVPGLRYASRRVVRATTQLSSFQLPRAFSWASSRRRLFGGQCAGPAHDSHVRPHWPVAVLAAGCSSATSRLSGCCAGAGLAQPKFGPRAGLLAPAVRVLHGAGAHPSGRDFLAAVG
jgi:hypothetical protein